MGRSGSMLQAEGTVGADVGSGRSSGKGVSEGRVSETGGEVARAVTQGLGHHVGRFTTGGQLLLQTSRWLLSGMTCDPRIILE